MDAEKLVVDTCIAAPRAKLNDLQWSPRHDRGGYVVKDLSNGEFFQLGEEEAFLLENLDGSHTVDSLCEEFAAKFGSPISPEEVNEFLELARSRGLLESETAPLMPTPPAPAPAKMPAPNATPAPRAAAVVQPQVAAPPPPKPRSGQSIFRWRQSLFDPDKFFNRLHPKITFLWTRTFLIFSMIGILAAFVVVWGNRENLLSSFSTSLRWETLAMVWVVLLAVTTLHEFAHGLTCKHFGGEVHEVGFLLLFFMPSMYCNVSDTWLFREKWKRLWVTLAGGYSDLIVWSLAAFTWRVTDLEGPINYVAYVILSVVGTRIMLNMNPLIKLDGYYFLSDLVEIPNLQQEAMYRTMDTLRWAFWGSQKPAKHPRARFLLLYGLMSWSFGLIFLAIPVLTMARFTANQWGPLASLSVLALSAFILRGMLQGLFNAEVWTMLTTRYQRTALWAGAAVAGVAFLALGMVNDCASGGFQLRPAVRNDVRAPVAGFLKEVHVDEGDTVRPGKIVAVFAVPNLDTRIAQARADVRETTARLNSLQAGTRNEERLAQHQRVERARVWRDQAKADLTRARAIFLEEVNQYDRQAAQARAEVDYSRGAYERAVKLRNDRAVSEDALRDAEKRLRIAQAQVEQFEAQGRARQKLNCRDAETELARRERELAEAESSLTLLEAGTRPEDIEAEKARQARYVEELHYLEKLSASLVVHATLEGVVTTPRMTERIGQYFHEGEVVFQIEQPGALEAEIVVADQEMAHVKPGQEVVLKPRNAPRQTLHARVERVAPRAMRNEASANAVMVVVCRLDDAPPDLKAGTLGHARIYCGRQPVREMVLDHFLRLIRTDFWF